MAVVMLEGFDHLSNTQYPSKGWAGVLLNAPVAGSLGGQAARVSGAVTTRNLPATYSTLIAGFRFRTVSQLNTGRDYFVLKSGATLVCRLQFALVGADTVFRLLNSAGTTLGTGTFPIVTNTWMYLEIECVVSATVGQVELRINGTTVDITTAASLNTGSSNLDAVQLGNVSGTNFDYDDVYVVDTSGSAPTNTWLGDSRVETLAPDGNGASTAWTGVYTDIDDSTSHDSDTTYINSSTPGDRETATLSDLAVGTGTVYAVQANVVARKDDAGSRTIAPVLRISGTNYDGTTTAGLGTDYTDYTQLYDRLDPVGNAWSIATVNAMEAGVKEVA